MIKKNNGTGKMTQKFVLFIMISIVFWFMTKLSKEYESTIDYPVVYKNLPENKLLQETPLEMIKIHIKSTGFKLITSKIFPKILYIDTSNLYSKTSTNYYILLSQQRLALQKQMKKGIIIDHFINDTIVFNLGSLKEKKVPIAILSDISYAVGYELNGGLAIVPDSIIVNGPESILDTIREVYTKLFKRKDLNSSFKEIVEIKPFPSEYNIKIKNKTIQLSAAVEKFTEGTIEVPFNVINLPKGKTINTFPKAVKVTYRVPLSDFHKIGGSSFLIECDYRLSQENNLSYLIPKLVDQSSMVRNIRISPLKIDFIINK